MVEVRVEFTMEQQQAIWEGWRDGESFRQVGHRVGQPAHVVQYFLRGYGGIKPDVPRRNRRHLSRQEREEISRGIAAGLSLRRISAVLGRSHSSISRELARNGGRAAYRATAAEQAARVRIKRPKLTRLKQRPALLQVVKAKLILGWSPEQIAAWLKLAYPEDASMRLSHEGIYRSIYYVYRRELDRGMSRHLRSGSTIRRPRKAKQSLGRGRLKNRVPITARPASIEDRVEVGHWEGDLVMGKRPSAVATLVERTTRAVKVVHLPDGYKADAVRVALTQAFKAIPEPLRRSLTWDRGREMAEHQQLSTDLRMNVYFCAPGSPWQRGSNENTNGMLRQYLTKGSDLRRFTAKDLDDIANLINDRPRQVLKWASSNELYQAHITASNQAAILSESQVVR
ncbi:IS30 family transposase [Specibacter sp. NPDC078692]|uniref:IS30 family transposase n=1 Tax=Specibacter sp. NPDC078692 TaxID=3155818 RepID=UPI003424D46B